MNQKEFGQVVARARSQGFTYEGIDDTILHGCGLKGFEPVCVTLDVAAAFVKWQCGGIFGGWWDEVECNSLRNIFRHKVQLLPEPPPAVVPAMPTGERQYSI